MNKFASILICLTAFCVFNFTPNVQAEEIDFSCMKQRVRAKVQVAERYREYDIIVENRCPGDVYWSLCIERLDPWTHQVVEVLTPSGKILADKKFRVNLQMKQKNKGRDQKLYEELYVSDDYGIKSVKKAQCVARQCELEKRDLRQKYLANQKAWNQSKTSFAERLATECPTSGWGSSKREDCETRFNQTHQAELDPYAQTEADLLQKLSAVDPQRCQIHSAN